MARICPLFSSSSGNSTYISSASGGILIDAGASCKQLLCALQNAGGSAEKIKAIAITHEHSDHIKGLRVLLNKIKVPLIASSETLSTLCDMGVIPPETTLIPAEEDTELAGLIIHRFSTSHDCRGSSGYSITFSDGKRAAVCTDLGVITDEVKNNLLGCDAVLIESNHDIRMLKNGPYPPQLKMRILSDSGHLSNGSCAAILPELLKCGATRFILGHLSRHNNLPMLALSASKEALSEAGAEDGRDYLISIAAPMGNGVTVI